MADIKQAAKWMREGKQVLDGSGFKYKRNPENGMILIGEENGWEPANFYDDDIFSENWELA